MKIAIKFDDYFVAPAEKITAILEALASGELYTCSGWSLTDESVLTKSDKKPSVSFVEDSQFQEADPLVETLRKEKAASDSRWVEYYQQTITLKKEKAELEERIAKLTSTLSGE